MKFTATVVLFAAGAYAAAASSSAASGDSTITAAPAHVTYKPSAQQECMSKNCKAGDVNCAASCVGVPYPNSAQIEDTHSCEAKCHQSDSTYAQCLDSCVNKHYYNPTSVIGGGAGGKVAPTGTDAQATGTDAGSQATGSAATASASGSGSKNATATGNSANQVGLSFVGMVGAAFVALVL